MRARVLAPLMLLTLLLSAQGKASSDVSGQADAKCRWHVSVSFLPVMPDVKDITQCIESGIRLPSEAVGALISAQRESDAIQIANLYGLTGAELQEWASPSSSLTWTLYASAASHDMVRLMAVFEHASLAGRGGVRPTLDNVALRDGLRAAVRGNAILSVHYLIESSDTEWLEQALLTAVEGRCELIRPLAEALDARGGVSADPGELLFGAALYCQTTHVRYLLALDSPNRSPADLDAALEASAFHRSVYTSEQTWALLVANGADPVATVCAYSADTMVRIENGGNPRAKRWINEIRASCASGT